MIKIDDLKITWVSIIIHHLNVEKTIQFVLFHFKLFRFQRKTLIFFLQFLFSYSFEINSPV